MAILIATEAFVTVGYFPGLAGCLKLFNTNAGIITG